MDVFKLWCWRRLLRVPQTARRWNQSILKEINLEYSLEEPMLKLKPQYFGHLMWRADLLGKTLMLGKTEGIRRRGWQGMKWLNGFTNSWTWVWANCGRWWGTGKPGVLQSMGSQRVGHGWANKLLVMAVTASLLRNLEQQAQILSGIGGALLLHFSELCNLPAFYSEVVFLSTLFVFL